MQRENLILKFTGLVADRKPTGNNGKTPGEFSGLSGQGLNV